MNFNNNTNGAILICDATGIIEEILYVSDQFNRFFQIGEIFSLNIHPKSLYKALSFLTELKATRAAFDCEIDYELPDNVKQLLMQGFLKDSKLIIIASSIQSEFRYLCQELLMINNEQLNNMRKMAKESIDTNQIQSKADSNHFDEISKLNNDLMNTQRELARKIEQLRQLNIKLEEMSTKDSLTGLSNRRNLFDKFKEEIIRANRMKFSLTIMMIDINNFKQVNDTLGHPEGDILLKRFAEIALTHTRQGLDSVYRIGGDEFFILMTDCDERIALMIAQRLNEHFIKYTEIASLAYGIIEIDLESDISIEDYFKKADEQMYEFKINIKRSK